VKVIENKYKNQGAEQIGKSIGKWGVGYGAGEISQDARD
jgi:hypothetical protein